MIIRLIAFANKYKYLFWKLRIFAGLSHNNVTRRHKKRRHPVTMNAAGHLKNPPIKGSFHLWFFKCYVIPNLFSSYLVFLKPIKNLIPKS